MPRRKSLRIVISFDENEKEPVDANAAAIYLRDYLETVGALALFIHNTGVTYSIRQEMLELPRKLHLWWVHGDTQAKTICRGFAKTENTTLDPEEVTCKNCLREILAKKKPSAEI